MNGFEEAIRAHGLIPVATPAPDGKWHRCKTETHPKRKNGAFKIAPDGLIAWYWDLARDSAPITYRPDGETSVGLPAFDAAALKKRRKEDQAKKREATKRARAYYEAAAPLIGGHPYLTAHNLDMTGCHGLRSDREGRLVVPMRRDGEIISLQRIDAEGQKRFWRGAPVVGASYWINRRGATLTVLCEGLATGLALYAAVPAARVVVCFTAGGLIAVAPLLDVRGMVAVAADNDHGTAERIGVNPGVEKAHEAAALLGCGVAVPEGISGTDWCDWRAEGTAARVEATGGYGRRRETEAQARRVVDAEINRHVMRVARMRWAS